MQIGPRGIRKLIHVGAEDTSNLTPGASQRRAPLRREPQVLGSAIASAFAALNESFADPAESSCMRLFSKSTSVVYVQRS